ncbi:hypothetical protein FB45DRAFT_1054244 [Roridomyces roridus]|uniref:Uncharacterized protein n=1 Tax=Roridomyces roridus TaxID=1738132 RepID=A0AAD7C8A2_9AGAR|nr:hypothetical protein FB45DRAFT_1054244 [Roridomyces roridus]
MTAVRATAVAVNGRVGALGTNATCTLLIGLRAWQHRRITSSLNIIESENGSRRQISTNRILSLLVESGFIYCLFWLTQLILFVPVDRTAPVYYLYDVFSGMGDQISGMYPTLIIVIYPTAETREVARLDAPSRRSKSSAGQWSRRPRFWFDPRAFSGWEAKNESLLEFLLALDVRTQPLFAVVDQNVDSAGIEVEVEVLIPESKLAHFCEGCGDWEAANAYDESLRWYMVRDAAEHGTLPGYLCPSCHAKDWFGARAVRYLGRAFCCY